MRKHCSEPYFSLLQSGRKKAEGRINIRDWKDLKVDDEIIFFCDDKEFKCRVTRKVYFDSIESMVESVGHDLLPDHDLEDKDPIAILIAADDYYSIFAEKCGSVDKVKSIVNRNGMVSVYFEPCD